MRKEITLEKDRPLKKVLTKFFHEGLSNGGLAEVCHKRLSKPYSDPFAEVCQIFVDFWEVCQLLVPDSSVQALTLQEAPPSASDFFVNFRECAHKH